MLNLSSVGPLFPRIAMIYKAFFLLQAGQTRSYFPQPHPLQVFFTQEDPTYIKRDDDPVRPPSFSLPAKLISAVPRNLFSRIYGKVRRKRRETVEWRRIKTLPIQEGIYASLYSV